MINKSQKREIGIGVLFSYLNIIFQFAAYVLYPPLSLRYLGNGEYGVYTLCTSMMSALAIIEMGLPSAYLKYYIQYQEEGATTGESGRRKIEELNGVFLVIFLSLGAIALCCGLMIAAFPRQTLGGKLTNAELELSQKLLVILTVNIALTVMGSFFRVTLLAHEKFTLLKGIDAARTVANPFLGMLLLLAGFCSTALGLLALLITAVCVGISAMYSLKCLHMRFAFSAESFRSLKRYWIFSLFIFLHMLMDQMNWQVDKWLLARFSGSVAITMYSLGAQMNTLYIKCASAISEMFTARVHIFVAGGENARLNALFAKVGKAQFIVTLYVYLGFLFLGRAFLYLWLREEYETSYRVALILMSPLVILLAQNLRIEILRAYELHKAQAMIDFLIGILNVLISVPLCNAYGETGCAIGTMASMWILYYPFSNYYLTKYTPICLRQFYGGIFHIAFAAIVPTVGFWMLSRRVFLYSWRNFVLFGVGYSVVYFFFIFRVGLTRQERETVIRYVRKVKLKRR